MGCLVLFLVHSSRCLLGGLILLSYAQVLIKRTLLLITNLSTNTAIIVQDSQVVVANETLILTLVTRVGLTLGNAITPLMLRMSADASTAARRAVLLMEDGSQTYISCIFIGFFSLTPTPYLRRYFEQIKLDYGDNNTHL